MTTVEFHRISKAVADPRRMDLLERISSRPETACSMLLEGSDVSQPTLSHHLKELSSAGLITSRWEAKFCFYRLNRKLWREYLAEMRRRVPVSNREK